VQNLIDQKIKELYEFKKLSCAAISEIDGRSEGTIYNRLKAQGVQIRSRSDAAQKFSTQIAIALYNLGLSVAQVGTLLKVHSTTVLKRLQGEGFPLRTPAMAGTIGYSEKEFQLYFNTPEFISHLKGGKK
jgi:transposase